MDRDNRWERTELAWRAMVLGKGQTAVSAESAIRAAYAAGDTDEFIRPILLPAFQPIEEGDQLICFNFRKWIQKFNIKSDLFRKELIQPLNPWTAAT